jgi:hypothetical protein
MTGHGDGRAGDAHDSDAARGAGVRPTGLLHGVSGGRGNAARRAGAAVPQAVMLCGGWGCGYAASRQTGLRRGGGGVARPAAPPRGRATAPLWRTGLLCGGR